MQAATAAPDGNVVRRFKPYPAYKDSGVEWLGKIPAHWQARRLKYLAALNPDALSEETDLGFEMIYVDIGGVDGLGRIIEKEALTFGAAPTRARRLVKSGDVIASTVRTYLRAIAPIADPEPNLVVSTGFAVVRPWEDLKSEYAAYALRAPYFVERVVANSKGVSFPAINESEMATYRLAVPQLEEQRTIATFLDRETAKIDALVAKKERLIELLHEQRTALITRAVTRGLDSSAPMKDSGAEWLGEIPSHWEVKALKHLAKLRAGAGITAESIDEVGEFPVFGGNGIRGFTSSFTHEGDFPLIGRQGALCGCVNFASGRFWASEHAVVAAPQADVHPYWLAYLLRAMSLNSYSESAAQPGLAVDTISGLHVPAPGFPEQRAIAAFLDREAARIDALVAKVRDAIERLKELRAAIISAAVTGKIDVRKEAA